MKEEYDFSGGERGKFYHEAAEFALPIYLEPDVAAFLQKVAIKKVSKLRQSLMTGSGKIWLSLRRSFKNDLRAQDSGTVRFFTSSYKGIVG